MNSAIIVEENINNVYVRTGMQIEDQMHYQDHNYIECKFRLRINSFYHKIFYIYYKDRDLINENSMKKLINIIKII